MAKRITLTHEPDVRAKIQASQLVNRLQDHANGLIELSTTQIAAAKILLSKKVPDLSSIELVGNADKPIEVSVTHSDQEIIKRYAAQPSAPQSNPQGKLPHE